MRFDRCHKPQPTSNPKSTPAPKRTIDYSYSLQNESDHFIPPPPGSFRGISQEWLAEDMAIQAKLTIGQPNDRYEQEADQMAKQVVRQMYKPNFELSQARTAAELTFPYPNLKPKSLIRRKPAIDLSGAIPTSPALETAIHQAKSGGHPLPKHLRQPMERSFGADFSQVRVHTDHQADRLSRSISAEAFTTGRDIFFRQGTYRPESSGGQELLAHELTHVVQQQDQISTGNIMPMIIQRVRSVSDLKGITQNHMRWASGDQTRNIVMDMESPWHLTCYPNNETKRKWPDMARQPMPNMKQQHAIPSLEQFMIDEFHLTKGREDDKKHFYYTDQGDPQEKSQATNAWSPFWNDKDWGMSNQLVTHLLPDKNQYELNQIINENSGSNLLPTSAQDEANREAEKSQRQQAFSQQGQQQTMQKFAQQAARVRQARLMAQQNQTGTKRKGTDLEKNTPSTSIG